jgi:ribosomal protein S18 acetylase RimI-like enzyme
VAGLRPDAAVERSGQRYRAGAARAEFNHPDRPRDGAIVATVMVGHDGHRGWVYYVATNPDHRGKGFGRAIMNAAEDWLRAAGILKLQLLVRRENDKAGAFYQSIGYEEAQTIVFAKWLDGRIAT